MSNTPEIEVLRIEGNVTVDKTDVEAFSEAISATIGDWALSSSVNIVPQDSPTGMRLYRVEDIEKKDNHIAELSKMVDTLKSMEVENDKAYSDLAEQLRQEKERVERWKNAFNLMEEKFKNEENECERWYKAYDTASTKLEFMRQKMKDSPIKAGLKRIWKWFKGLVGK